jgi:membrane-bound metal-dependent hydrolase YbcI (DUF457 family)
MKGIAHFLTGVALATCVPGVIPLAREGSLLPVLGGIAGLLPDYLDFRFVRYLTRYDVEVDPAPMLVHIPSAPWHSMALPAELAREAAAYVVDLLAETMRDAYESGAPRRLISHTVRCGADLWRQYTIRFDPQVHKVAACIGPLVTTSQAPVPLTVPDAPIWVERQLDFPIAHTYQRVYPIDIFTGPSFTFVREREALVVHFLDWHHRWTHSLVLAAALGVGATLVGNWLWGSAVGWLAGLISALAFGAHVLEDQLGHMGCNLFWPLTQHRRPGLGLLHAGDAAPNFLTVWSAMIVILLNLYRAGNISGPAISSARGYLVAILAAPWVGYATHALTRRQHDRMARAESAYQADPADAERLAESQDGEAR